MINFGCIYNYIGDHIFGDNISNIKYETYSPPILWAEPKKTIRNHTPTLITDIVNVLDVQQSTTTTVTVQCTHSFIFIHWFIYIFVCDSRTHNHKCHVALSVFIYIFMLLCDKITNLILHPIWGNDIKVGLFCWSAAGIVSILSVCIQFVYFSSVRLLLTTSTTRFPYCAGCIGVFLPLFVQYILFLFREQHATHRSINVMSILDSILLIDCLLDSSSRCVDFFSSHCPASCLSFPLIWHWWCLHEDVESCTRATSHTCTLYIEQQCSLYYDRQ